MDIETVKDQTFRCIGCSECFGRGPYVPFVDGAFVTPEWTCPTLDYFKFFSHNARSKQFLARELLHNEDYPISEDIIKVSYADLGCGICDAICPRPHNEFHRALKDILAERGYMPEPNRKLNSNIKNKYNIFGAKPEKRTHWTDGLDLPKSGKVVYYAGCYSSYRQPEVAKATVEILREAGIDVAFLGNDEWCCGLHPGWSGDRKLEADMAEHNIEALADSGAQEIVFSCAMCYRTFKTDYPELNSRLNFKFTHIAELLPDLISSKKLTFEPAEKLKVTYHDPCFMGREHLGRSVEIYKQPRQIIMSLPDIDFAEMPYHGIFAKCCGSGSSVVSANFPEFTHHLSKNRVLEAKAVAEAIITSCPRCVENFRNSAKKEGISVDVKDITVLVAQQLKGRNY